MMQLRLGAHGKRLQLHSRRRSWRWSGGSITTRPAFERTSKRRRGFPSETHVKRCVRVVHGDKELQEKLGRNDPCPCLSGRRFQELLHAERPLSTVVHGLTTFRE